MHSSEIACLIRAVSERYDGFEYYGSSPQELHGVGFKLKGIPASFSAHSEYGGLKDCYNIQVEGVPPGNYAYADEVSLDDFLELISRYRQSPEEWP